MPGKGLIDHVNIGPGMHAFNGTWNARKFNGTAREASGIKANNYGDTASLGTSVVISIFLTLLIFALSMAFRYCNPVLFCRQGEGQSSPGTYIEDVVRGSKANAEEVIAVAGLDAWMLLEFYTLARRITDLSLTITGDSQQGL